MGDLTPVAPAVNVVKPRATSVSPGGSGAAKVAPTSPYGITLEELRALNQDQMTEANLAELNRLGGLSALAGLLCVNLEHGLPQSEIDASFALRRERFGRNEFRDAPMKSLVRLFIESLQDTTLIILMCAAVASLVTGYIEHPDTGWSEGVAILVGVMLVASVTSVNNYSKEKQFRALSAKNDDVQVKVLRAGQPDKVSVGELTVGDVVILETGDRIPADAVLIRAQDLKCNESSLTGEPDDVTKTTQKDPFLLSSCMVASGRGEALVLAVGLESRWGKIKSKLVREQHATPLMEKLERMAKQIGYVGMFFSVATMSAMLIVFAVSPEKRAEQSWANHVLHTFLIGVTIIVVAIPEGLPLAVTISLSYSTKRMLRDNNLIRVLAACETMGNVTSICSDKTGTLTENKMTVVDGWILGRSFASDVLRQATLQLPVHEQRLLELAQSIAVNTSAFLQQAKPPASGLVVQGNKTEGALLLLLHKLGLDYMALRKTHFQDSRGDRLFPFSSTKKTMSAMVRRDDQDDMWRLYTKGAAEVVLARCTECVSVDGQIVTLTPTKRSELNSLINRMADASLRTICVAFRDVHARDLQRDVSDLLEPPEDQLVAAAIFGIHDPLRADVVEAIRDCQHAGIMVRMVTGDNLHTASAIARECGILSGDGLALEGPVFRTMTPDQLAPMLPRLQVLARSSPDDKFRLVNLLRARDEVVGVTGDGTNDAPALRTADVGLAMGIAGTDLAKEASDIIIMDDRFSSIRSAVLWGRCVYDSIRKFLQFQLTVNVVALIVTFVSAVTGRDPPLNSVMMLWINLIMDTMGALALGTEAPTMQLLARPPFKKSAHLIGHGMLKNIIVQAVFQLLVVFLLLTFGHEQFGLHEGNYCLAHEYKAKSKSVTFSEDTVCVTLANTTCTSRVCADYASLDLTAYPTACLDTYCAKYDYRHYTVIFNTFVFAQVFNEFNARRTNNDWRIFNGLRSNRLFLFIIVTTIAVQVMLAELGGNFTRTTGLSITQWLVCLGFGALSLPVGFLMRLIPIRESPGAYANPNNVPQG